MPLGNRRTWLSRFGVTFTLVDGKDLEAVEKGGAQGDQGLLHGAADQPDSGSLRHRRGGEIARSARRPARRRQRGRDAAVPEPALQLGADVVVYSATKHIDGQGRVLGGVILSSEKIIADHYHNLLRQTGPTLPPFNAWVLLKDLEDARRPCRAPDQDRWRDRRQLAGHDKLARLIYPRPRRPPSGRIVKQMKAGSARSPSKSRAVRKALSASSTV